MANFKNVTINGHHARKLKYLCDDLNIFDRYYDAFVFASCVGIIENVVGAVEKDGNDSLTIAQKVFNNHQHKIDILFNGAGIAHREPLVDMEILGWQNVMDVNVKSMFLAFKHAFPHLRKNRRAYVVNVGSISSFVGQGGTPAYTASKGAVLQLARSIALDYARYGIRCNCVCPGITDTPMLRQHLKAASDPAAQLAGRLNRVPLNVALTPFDIAKSILYLSCEDSAGITGTSLIVDGGYLAAAEWNCSAVG